MPNPKTIEELLNMKPCPFEDGKPIPEGAYEYAKKHGLIDKTILSATSIFRGEPFKMPDGYYYLPPDKQLGLPLGKWSMKTIRELCNKLPYGVVTQYFHNIDFALCGSWRSWHPSDFRNDNEVVEIKEQPPNLYNPLGHKE